ncbi:NUC153 domain protein [Ancylostoma duodenale]|uniref:NUC153 domain protein n=1 Tax=Ancylostoma duodenale TaxID=51022 RepID=A0A0C2DHN7_9BILA|nr:NUC153 domain protein [Ancylostoma duodenale]
MINVAQATAIPLVEDRVDASRVYQRCQDIQLERREEHPRNVRRRVQLIQDFEMPDVSHTINISRDGRYVFATGCYKSWLKCYDLENLSQKFERGLDAAVIKLISLSDDYSKNVVISISLVQGTTDGQVEAWDHRDKSRVGVLDCVYSLNGSSGNVEITALSFRDALRLGVGTSTGQVLVYDIRSSKPLIVKDHINELPIKKIDFVIRESENLVLSMDSRVLKMWSENEGKPFAAIETENGLNDFCRYPNSGKMLRRSCLDSSSRSGLIFFANEAPRMQQFFIPALGPAPKWCSYLEAITEELEENQSAAVYDDYKFVTKEELESLSLSHLIGSSVLRAYMHGYFVDRRLYEKAQLITQPFAYEKYKDRKIRDLLHEERENKLIKTKVESNQAKVNKELAARLQEEAATQVNAASSAKKKKNDKKKAMSASAILEDDRFKRLFNDEDFEVDHDSEQFKRSVLAQQKEKSTKTIDYAEDDDLVDEEQDVPQSELPTLDEAEDTFHRSEDNSSSDSDSDTDEEMLSSKKKLEREKARRKQEQKERHYQQYEEKFKEREAERETFKCRLRAARLVNKPKKFVFHELDSAESTRKFLDEHVKESNDVEEYSSLAAKKTLMQEQGEFEKHEDVFGGRSMTFTLAKKGAQGREAKAAEERRKHEKERKATVRKPTLGIKRSLKKLPGNLSKP